MAKKQIKELVILTKMEGGKQATEQVKALETALNSVTKSAVVTNRELGGQVKVAQNVARAYDSIAKSMDTVVASSRSLNKALNGDTKTAAKNLGAYIDNLQIATLYMKDLSDEAERASKSIGKVGGGGSEMQVLINFIEQIYLEIVDLNDGLVENIRVTKQVRNNLGDLGVTADRTQEEIEALNGTYDKTRTTSDKLRTSTDMLNNSARRLAGSGSQGARAFSDLAFRMNPLVSLYASIAVNVYAVTEAFRILNAAANLNRLQEQTAEFASSLSGINIKGLASDLQELSGYAISSADALRQTVRGVSYGFLVEDMERLTVGARGASIALGVDFADAMDRAFRGISKGEVEILDEIGVVTRLDTAYAKYAVTLNKSADALTEVERKQALTNEVISQLESRFSAFDVAASGMERLGVATKDATDSMLILAATSLDGVASDLARFLTGFAGVKSAQDKAIESQKVYNAAIKSGNYSQATVALDDYRKALVEITKENTKGTKENAKYVESQKAAETAALATSRATSALILYATYYAGTVLVGLITRTYTTVTATIALAASQGLVTAATKGSLIVTALYATALGVKTAALFVARSAVIAYSVAVAFGIKATLALLTPLVLIAAKVALLAAAVVGLANLFNYLSKTLFDFDAFEWIGKKISWLGDKLKELFPTLFKMAKEFGTSVLDGVSSISGVDKEIENLFKLQPGALEGIADSQVNEYVNSLIASAAKIPKNLVMLPIGIEPAPGLADKLKSLTDPLGVLKEEAKNVGQNFVEWPISRQEAEANLKYFAASKSAVESIGEEFNSLSGYETSFSKLAKGFESLAGIPLSVNVNEANFKDVKTRFEDLQSRGIIPAEIQWRDGKGIQEFSARVQSAAQSLEYYDKRGAFLLEAFNAALDSSDPTSNIKAIGVELQLINNVLADQDKLSKTLNANQRQALEDKRAILEIKAQELDREYRIKQAFDAQDISLEKKLANRQQQVHLQSELLNLELESLTAKLGILTSEGKNTEELRKQIELMKIRLGIAKSSEVKTGQGDSLRAAIGIQEERVSQAGSATRRVKEQETLLKLKEIEANLMTDELDKNRALLDIEIQRAQLKRDTSAAPFADAGAVFSSISSIDGLTDLQSNFAGTLGTLSTTYSDFLSNMDSQSMSFVEYLSGNLDALANVGQAALGMAQSIYSEISAGKIESIDQEIAAEQRRDGKSAESLSKIKKLNAQKIKEETKAKKASVVMSTAMAIMQSFAEFGIWGAIPAAAMAAMGMVQLANIDKAANGQLAALNGSGGGDLSISAGNRDNSIDVSKSANAGELGYLRGQSGTGSANNFTPGRAGGNYAMAGAAITVGESGPETIVPTVPVNVQPAGKSTGASITYAPVYQMQAIDSAGMEELMMRHSRSVYASIESELNANNMTLQALDSR